MEPLYLFLSLTLPSPATVRDLAELALMLASLVLLPALRRAAEAHPRSLAWREAEALARVVVLAGEKTVRDLKDPALPGTWDAAQGEVVKRQALATLKQLGAGAVATLGGHLGPGLTLDDALSALIEAQVRWVRLNGGADPAPAAPPPTPLRAVPPPPPAAGSAA